MVKLYQIKNSVNKFSRTISELTNNAGILNDFFPRKVIGEFSDVDSVLSWFFQENQCESFRETESYREIK